MRLAKQVEYREHTLLFFESRVRENGVPVERHWTVVAPDGINIIGRKHATEADARAAVDARMGPAPPTLPHS